MNSRQCLQHDWSNLLVPHPCKSLTRSDLYGRWLLMRSLLGAVGFCLVTEAPPPTPDAKTWCHSEQLFLANSRFFVRRNKRDWFQVRDWPQNQPWNCLGQKGVTDNECRLGWHGWQKISLQIRDWKVPAIDFLGITNPPECTKKKGVSSNTLLNCEIVSPRPKHQKIPSFIHCVLEFLGGSTNAAASHDCPIEMFWHHFWGAVKLSILMYNQSVLGVIGLNVCLCVSAAMAALQTQGLETKLHSWSLSGDGKASLGDTEADAESGGTARHKSDIIWCQCSDYATLLRRMARGSTVGKKEKKKKNLHNGGFGFDTNG